MRTNTKTQVSFRGLHAAKDCDAISSGTESGNITTDRSLPQPTSICSFKSAPKPFAQFGNEIEFDAEQFARDFVYKLSGQFGVKRTPIYSAGICGGFSRRLFSSHAVRMYVDRSIPQDFAAARNVASHSSVTMNSIRTVIRSAFFFLLATSNSRRAVAIRIPPGDCTHFNALTSIRVMFGTYWELYPETIRKKREK